MRLPDIPPAALDEIRRYQRFRRCCRAGLIGLAVVAACALLFHLAVRGAAG